jgi:uncharacterized protein (DUF849 family)
MFEQRQAKDHDRPLHGCIYGRRTLGEYPALPVTPHDLSLKARLAAAAEARL